MSSRGTRSLLLSIGGLLALSLPTRPTEIGSPIASSRPADVARPLLAGSPIPARTADRPGLESSGSRTIAASSAAPAIFLITPFSGPAAGGTNASIYGLNFQAGATVTIGGVPATGVAVPSATQITTTVPALTPGTVNDVLVTNPDASKAALTNAWFAEFLDVPPSHLFRRSIEKLRRRGITTGCGGGNYCPESSVTRAQMAIFILRGKHGSGYHPPPATGTVFDDVRQDSFGADWIEQFAAEGITSGCGGKNYCPNNAVTRGEMAVFLLRAKHGSNHNPPPPIGTFSDVPPDAPFAKWIEELAAEGITSGCGSGNYCPGSPSTRGQMAVFLIKTFAGTSQELIAEALAEGDIDYPTSLLYRAYALFWDARLPAAFDGAGSDGEDSGFFEEVRLIWPEFSASEQAALEPFLVRPDDPKSVFGPVAPRGLRPADEAGTECETFWIGTSAPGSNFKVHNCATADPAGDTFMRASVNATADSLWTPMTMAPPAGMGPPRPDLSGGDAKIDIYLVATNQCRLRNGECVTIPGTVLARMVHEQQDPPELNAFGREVSSGYILIDRNLASSSSLKSIFAHEFFHLLQNAHNYQAKHREVLRIDGRPVYEKSWFVEASATWAQWNFVPETAAELVHQRFVEGFQTSSDSLLDSLPKYHTYASYIWAFFLQQESGESPQPIFQIWVDIESAADPEDITDDVDAHLSFKEHFRDFAVRNLNVELPGDPLGVQYQDLDTSFPTDSPPATRNRGEITLASSPSTAVKIEALAAQYDHFVIAPEVRKVIFDFADAGDADVDVIASVAGTWKRIRVDTSPLVFCRDRPEENVDNLFLILSHHDKKRYKLLEGSYKIKRKASCNCGDVAEVPAWNGTLSFTYAHQASNDAFAVELSQASSVSFRILPSPGGGASWIGTVTGTASIHDKFTVKDMPPHTSNLDGEGPPLSTVFGFPTSRVSLNVNLETCEYNFHFTPTIDAVASGTESEPVTVDVGSVRGEDHPVGDVDTTLSGAGITFPAHSTTWGVMNEGEAYFPGGFGGNMFAIPGLATENNAGGAQVTWTFTPEPVPAGSTGQPNLAPSAPELPAEQRRAPRRETERED